MILVWIILIRFINLRVMEPDPSEFARNQSIALALYVAICLVAGLYFRRRFESRANA